MGALLAALVSCGGSAGAPSSPSNPVTVAVDAGASTAVAGGHAVTLHAVVSHSARVPVWHLTGPGHLSATSGVDILLVPPAIEELDAPSLSRVTASVDGASAQVDIALAPAPGHAWSEARGDVAHFTSVAWGGGNFIAFGDRGIMQSVDGRLWKEVFASNAAIRSSVWDANGWLTIDGLGRILTSETGVDWVVAGTALDAGGAPLAFDEFASGNGTHVGRTASGEAYVSSDGLHWKDTGVVLQSVAFGNGRYVGSILVAPLHAALVTSVSGDTWVVESPEIDASEVAFGNGHFVAGSRDRASTTYTSDDGLHWELQPSNLAWPGTVAFAGNLFYFIGSPDLDESNDGVSWTSVVPGFVDRISGIASDGHTYVRVTEMGDIATSPDGHSWDEVVRGSVGDIRAMASDGSRFVALGAMNRLLTSTDTTTWVPGRMARDAGWEFSPLAIAFGHGVWVASGSLHSLEDSSSTGEFYRSDDGVTWSRAASPLNGGCESVIHDGSRFLCIDGLNVLESVDGRAWTPTHPYPFGWGRNAIAFGDGVHVVADVAGRIATSRDLVTWTLRASTTHPMFGITWNGVRFVAVGEGGFVLSSANAIDWTPGVSGSSETLLAVTSIPGQFIAVGTNGTIIGSADGLSWTPRASPTRVDLSAVVHAEGRYVAAGDNSVIAVSDH